MKNFADKLRDKTEDYYNQDYTREFEKIKDILSARAELGCDYLHGYIR